jgi:hypothetical protein
LKINRLCLFISFATLFLPIPLILDEIQVWEVFLYISFISYFPKIFQKKIKLNKLDKLVYYYFILSMISVIIDFENIILGMQSFRWTVIPPVIFYVIIRSNIKNINYYEKYYKIMLPGILIYAILFLQDSFLHNFTRSFTDEFGSIRIISLAYSFALGLSILLYLIRSKIIKTLSAILLIIALILTFTRSIIFGAIIIFCINYLLNSFKNYKLNVNKKYLTIVFLTFIIIIFNYANPESQIYDQKELKEIRKSSSRITDYDLFSEDLSNRMLMWNLFLDLSIDHTLLVGKGLSKTTIGFDETLDQSYASSHNFIISFFRRSGLLGILLLINLIVTSVNYLLHSFKYYGKNNSFPKFLLFNLLMLYFIGFSNDLFTGNRMTYLFIILAFISNFHMYTKKLKHNIL